MTKKTILSMSFLVLGIVIILFSTGSSVLTKSVFGIPMGNILIWFGFMALQLATYISNKGFKTSNSGLGKWIRLTMIGFIVLSILWFAIAYILSGNTSFNFSSSTTTYLGSPKASILYWYIIYALVIAPIVLTLVYNILRFFELRKARR